MRENRIAILTVQETHLLHTHIDKLNKLYGKCLHILHSELPDRASNCRRVAFVINKERLEYLNLGELSHQVAGYNSLSFYLLW
jgi:hypothetical protein